MEYMQYGKETIVKLAISLSLFISVQTSPPSPNRYDRIIQSALSCGLVWSTARVFRGLCSATFVK